MNKYHKIPLIAGLLYLLSLIISVTYSWLSGDHLFDLGISFSAYVGLHRWTSVMYFVFVAVITISMTVYISNNKIPFVKKIIDFINTAKAARADFIVTTEKDAVRIPKLERLDVPLYFLRVEIDILSGQESFDQCISRICFM